MKLHSSLLLSLIMGLLFSVGANASSPDELRSNQTRTNVMITDRYLEAVKELPVPYVISRFEKCDYGLNFDEKMAVRSNTKASDWEKFRRCKITYVGREIPCFNVRKDEIVYGAGLGRVWQFGERFCATNDLLVRRFTSKAGYFSTETPPHLNNRDVFNHYPQCQDSAVAFPDGSIRCKGDYAIVVVDRNHAVCAYGTWWTSGYLIGTRELTIIPDILFLQGVRCEGNHHIMPS